MRGITITDSSPDGGMLAVDLIDLLRLLGTTALDTEWEISGGESVGGAAAEELQRLVDAGTRVPGPTLLALAGAVGQVIDGRFAGYRDGEQRPWIIIRAVDSTAYDVQSDDESVLARMKQRFQSVAEFDSTEPSSPAQPGTERGPLPRARIAGR
jgi:hypothetical protein